MKLTTLARFAVALLLVAAIWGLLSFDRCQPPTSTQPAVRPVTTNRGPLSVGAARAPLAIDFPTSVGGYGPWRSTAADAELPLYARAIVFRLQGGETLGLVTLDVLLIPPQLRDAIAKAFPFPVWVMATHTHSGPSGYDPRLLAQVAALGRFDVDDFQVLANASSQALHQALAQLRPAAVSVGKHTLEEMVVPRSGSEVDTRLTQLRFLHGETTVAQLVIAAGHPTLVEFRTEHLHPDWPGMLALKFEEGGGPITLVVQGAGGNASINRDAYPTPQAVGERLAQVLRGPSSEPFEAELPIAWASVHIPLPRPDGTRLAPPGLTALLENLLCDETENLAQWHGLRVGPARFIFAPFELSWPAGRACEEAAGATRLISLTDGYLGYLETETAARAGEGESVRQYFPPQTHEQMLNGVRLLKQALE